jgi:catechol 2,3-dioxygenase-like lactoylglutathione lyase family enzyme
METSTVEVVTQRAYGVALTLVYLPGTLSHRHPSIWEDPVSRVQLALNVSDIDAAVAFYAKLFKVEPAKRRPGYANFAVADPPLKLVLIEDANARGTGVGGALNHLGVEVETSDEVGFASERLTAEGVDTLTQESTNCCYAVQDKVWVNDPDGVPWEVYTVLSDAPQGSDLTGDSGCRTVNGSCVPSATNVDVEFTPHGVPAANLAAKGCC